MTDLSTYAQVQGLTEAQTDARAAAVASGARRKTLLPEADLQSKNTLGVGATWATLNASGIPVQVRAYTFGNVGGQEYSQFSWVVPPSCDPAGTFRFRLHWAPSSTDTGGITWSFRQSYASDLEAIPTSSFAGILADTPGGVANNIQQTDWKEITISGLAVGDLLNWQIYRNSADAGDIFTGAALLIAVEFEYQEQAPTDD